MIEVIKILGCGVVYFLVVYLFIIRREARPIIPWSVCIASQVVCATLFDRIKGLARMLLPEAEFGSLSMVVSSAFLCLGNLILIFIMFGPVMNSIMGKNRENTQRKDEEIVVAPLSSVINMNPGQTAAGGAPEAAGDDITLDFIEMMIREGRRDEALRYLKMLAYYGKDEQSRSGALKMIDELTRAEA